jgi:uncharacterized protein
MGVTNLKEPKTPAWITVLKLALFIVPLSLACVWLWQQNEKYRGVKLYKTAFEYEMTYAELGVLNSQFYVAKAYDEGLQVDENDVEAVKWYKKAAAQSHAEAQYELGLHLLTGEGIPKDEVEAFVWVQRSSFKDFPKGELKTGQMMCLGQGTKPDCPKGVELIKKAAESGLTEAQLDLASRFERGDGVAKDLVMSYVYFTLAHEALNGPQGQVQSEDMVRLKAKLSPEQQKAAQTEIEARRPDPKMGAKLF